MITVLERMPRDRRESRHPVNSDPGSSFVQSQVEKRPLAWRADHQTGHKPERRWVRQVTVPEGGIEDGIGADSAQLQPVPLQRFGLPGKDQEHTIGSLPANLQPPGKTWVTGIAVTGIKQNDRDGITARDQ